MAAMGYNAETVRELMELVDNHKADIKESSYIQICNAVKFLHQRHQQQNQPPNPNEIPIPTIVRTDTIVHQVDPWRNNREVNNLRSIMRNLTHQIDTYRRYILDTTPGRITNADKFSVLTHNFAYTGPNRTTEMTSFINQLLQSQYITKRSFKELCDEAKMQRHTNDIDTMRSRLDQATLQLTQTRLRLIQITNA